MLQQHVEQDADVTVGCIEVPRAEASGFGVMHVDEKDRIIDLSSKSRRIRRRCPASPTCRSPAWAFMFSKRSSCSTSCGATQPIPTSSHDFGKDIIPYLVKNGRAVAHSFRPLLRALRSRECGAYWRDVGTVDAYWAANIDLTDVVPDLDIYDQDWPIWSYNEITPPGEIRARRGWPARVRRFRRWCREDASYPAQRCGDTLLSTGAGSIPSRSSRMR